jgi:hypothetical protein
VNAVLNGRRANARELRGSGSIAARDLRSQSPAPTNGEINDLLLLTVHQTLHFAGTLISQQTQAY